MTEHHAKMHKDEVSVTDATVRLLLSSQFPQWSEKSLERFPDSGTDSAIYRLDDDTGIRLPRIHWAVAQVDKEFDWLRATGTSSACRHSCLTCKVSPAVAIRTIGSSTHG